MTPSFFGASLPVGEALVKKGFLSQEQLKKILASKPKKDQRIGELAVDMGFMTELDLAKFLSQFFNLPYYEISADEELDTRAVELIPEKMARRYGCIILKEEEGWVTLAMADPLDVRAIDAVRLETKCKIKKVVSSKSSIQKAIERSYHTSSRIAKSMDSILSGETGANDVVAFSEEAEDPSLADQLQLEATDAPVVQFVNLILMRAVQDRASDVHIEPEENGVSVRFRVDGQLCETSAPPKHMFQAITTRIKLLSNLNIAERRLPQDGRFRFRVFEKEIDVRVSCLPLIHGEKIVMRILDRSALILDLKSLGFEPEMLKTFEKILKLPHGLIILTGPTGSGKTTTLYAALNLVKESTKNIITIEDPVEYQIAKVNQVQVKSEIGLTFADGLRSILRQDPDIVMVGEIRDRETAEICIRAALTGHLVLSTLHTNDAISAIGRLTDMGVEPYLLSATLNLIMAQRLVRKVCEHCSEPWNPPRELMDRLKDSEHDKASWQFKRGKGCPRCGGSGYRGRNAVYEQFIITDKIRSLMSKNASRESIEEAAKIEGFQTLLSNSFKKVQEGVTSLDEVFSVCSTQSELFSEKD